MSKVNMKKTGPILVIEDDLDDQEVIGEALQSLQLPNEIRFFHACEDALHYLIDLEVQPFIIICDMNLPGMTGIEFKRKINTHDLLIMKSIPFIFFTTSDQPRSVFNAYQLSIQGYFQKPGTMSEVRDVLEKVINYWQLCKQPPI